MARARKARLSFRASSSSFGSGTIQTRLDLIGRPCLFLRVLISSDLLSFACCQGDFHAAYVFCYGLVAPNRQMRLPPAPSPPLEQASHACDDRDNDGQHPPDL